MTVRMKPPKPIWCVIYCDGSLGFARQRRKQADADRGYGTRVIRYIPAPTTKRRKPRRKGYRAGGMS